MNSVHLAFCSRFLEDLEMFKIEYVVFKKDPLKVAATFFPAKSYRP